MFLILLSVVFALFAVVLMYVLDSKESVYDERGDRKIVKSYPLRKFCLAPLVLILLVVAFQSFTIVGAGHMGVQITLGTVNPIPLEAGVHFVNPVSHVKEINVQLQRAVLEKSSASTKDLQQVHTDIVINYRLSSSKVANIYKEFGVDVVDKVMLAGLNEAFKAVTAKYNSEELVTKRDEVSDAILQHASQKIAQFDITVDSISLVNFGFSEDYQHAIEQKVIATQQKQKAEQDLQRIEVEAKSRIAQAEGEAKAIAIQSQAIQQNGGENYVKLESIKKWDGKLPETIAGGVVPFIGVK